MPDASPAVFAVNAEKSHQGATGKNAGLHRAFFADNSTTALGVSWRLWSGTAPGARVTYEYDAFGNALITTGSTPNVYLYRGEQFDPDLGLYYLRARYYNPATGRFMSRDPYDPNLRNPDGTPIDPRELHKYLYTGGDPVNWIDPKGREELVEEGEEEEEEEVAVEPEVKQAGWELAMCYISIGVTIYEIGWGENPYSAAGAAFGTFAACFAKGVFTGPEGPPPLTPPGGWPPPEPPPPPPPGLPPGWCGLECWNPPPGTPIN
jgi:RHS repeat-associated protein